MKALTTFLILFWVCSLLPTFGQYTKFYYPDKTVSSEGTLRDGKPDGYWKTFYPSGTLKTEGNRKNFLLDSVWTFYFQNGDTSERIEYRAGKKNGFYLKFQQSTPSMNNLVVLKELWLDDRRNGYSYAYYPSGKLQMIVMYVEGLKQGEARIFDEIGNVVAINLYKNDFLVFSEKINRTDVSGMKQGIWKEFYPNGKVHFESNYRNNRLHGYQKIFDELGKMVASDRYDDGELVIEKVDASKIVTSQKENYPSGELRYLRTIQNGKPVGIQREFDKSGKVIASEVYNNEGRITAKGIVELNGKRSGDWVNLSPDSTVRSSGKYVNGLQSGKWTFFYPNGKVEQVGTYTTGKFSSEWKWYFPNGSLWKEENYENGLLEGLYTEYDITGKVICKGNYTAGERTGKWHTEVGDQIEDGTYLNGFREGYWKFFYPDNTLKFEGEFRGDNKVGTHKFYHQNGKLKEQREYRTGVEHGKWLQFDETGLQTLEIVYNMGNIVKIDGIPVEN